MAATTDTTPFTYTFGANIPQHHHVNSSINNNEDEPITDTIQRLKSGYGANSPETAEQLISIGDELTRKGNQTAAISCYQEAMSILDYRRSNSLLYDFEIKSKEYAVDMAVTMRKIGNLLREKNEFVGAAGKYCKFYLILYITFAPESQLTSTLFLPIRYTDRRSIQGVLRFIPRGSS